MEGRLRCEPCKSRYLVRYGVPRFVPDDGYAGSFGYEWNRFRTVQIDAYDVGDESGATFRFKTDCREVEVEEYLDFEICMAGIKH